MHELFDLSQKVAIVTGGGRGLGKAIALGLAGAGADLVVASRSLAACQEAAKEIENLGKRALPLACDMTKWDEIDSLVESTYAEFGKCDILVNNAGITQNPLPLSETSSEMFDEMYGVNTKGPMHLASAIAERMGRAGGGSIVNIITMGARLPAGHLGMYCSSKAATMALTRVMAEEWAPLGVRVNAVAPGPFMTDMLRDLDTATAGFIEYSAGVTLQKRIAQPEEIVGHLDIALPPGRKSDPRGYDMDRLRREVAAALNLKGLNIDPNNPRSNPDPAELRELGIGMVRFSYYDSSDDDEPDPVKLEFYRQKVQAYANAGINSLIVLDFNTYPDKPAFDASDAEWAAYIDLFSQRCGQIAEELAPWQPAFQIWTEPDFPAQAQDDYAPTLREEVYGQMLTQCSEAIKTADPGLIVVTAGLITGDPSWLGRVIESLDSNLPADAVAINTYGFRPTPDWPSPDWGFGYAGSLIENYHRLSNRPIWISEVGVSEHDLDNNPELVAEFLRRYYQASITDFPDAVQHVSWYAYSDSMAPSFGLVDEAGNPKPAYSAYMESPIME